MCLGKYFPPSMVTKLRNEITNFRQRPDESLFEAWEHYKLSIDRCPNHNMLLVTQIDTFYNGLTLRHRDTINAAAGGTFMKRHHEECYDLIKNMTAHHNDWDTSAQRSESSSSITSSSNTKIVALKAEMAVINKNLMRVLQVNQQVKAVTPSCETCGGPHFFNDCPATVGNTQNVYTAKTYQVHEDQFRFIFGFGNSPSPTIKTLLTNKDKLSELARTPLNEHCLAVLLKKLPEKLGDPDKFLIPCDFPRMAECLALADLCPSINLMPLSIWNKISLPNLSPTCMTLELAGRSISHPVEVTEDVFVKTRRALIDVFKGELTLGVGKEAITFNLNQISRYSANYNDMTAKRINVIDMDCEEYSQEVHDFFDVITSGNPTPYYDPIVSTTSLTLTPFGESDFLLEEVNTFLALDDDRTSLKVDQSYDDFKPAVQHQRRVNPKIHDVIKNKVLKLLDVGLIYPISDSPWVSLVHCVPKKGGFTVVKNEENELISTRLVTGWRVCIDYQKLNEATCKDHFPLPFMDQRLKRLVGNEHYYFLDGFSGYAYPVLCGIFGSKGYAYPVLCGSLDRRSTPIMFCVVLWMGGVRVPQASIKRSELIKEEPLEELKEEGKLE
nr:reverse transcriptase domain-containing protein [Tanacetum cinerariifolium]